MEAALIVPVTTIINLMWEKKPTGPNPKNELVDTKCNEKWGFNYVLARTGVWWAGIPGTAAASTFILWHADPSPVPHWLSTVWLQSSRTLPKSHVVFFLFPFHPKSTFPKKV